MSVNLFDLTKLETNLHTLEAETLKEGFWNNNETSGSILQEIKKLKHQLERYQKLKSKIEASIEMNDLLLLEPDEELEKELQKETKQCSQLLEKIEIETLLSGKYDESNAILTIHPGAGGTESQDWAEMLYRMYTRWSMQNGYETKELDYLEGEEAGIKSVTLLVSGSYAYG